MEVLYEVRKERNKTFGNTKSEGLTCKLDNDSSIAALFCLAPSYVQTPEKTETLFSFNEHPPDSDRKKNEGPSIWLFLQTVQSWPSVYHHPIGSKMVGMLSIGLSI